MPFILHPDGRRTLLTLSPGAQGGDDLATLQAAVGGFIEAVLFVNEDGHRLGLPLNPYASTIAGQAILGDVVLGSRKDLGFDRDERDDDDDDNDEEEGDDATDL